MRKKNGSGGINLPDFRLYYKAIVIKTVCYWHKNRNIDQWNKIENREINWTATCRRMKLEQLLTPYTKINLKCIKDLNVRLENYKTLRSIPLGDINHSKILYDPPPRVMEIKTKMNKWDLINLKPFTRQRKLQTR